MVEYVNVTVCAELELQVIGLAAGAAATTTGEPATVTV